MAPDIQIQDNKKVYFSYQKKKNIVRDKRKGSGNTADFIHDSLVM